MFQIWSLFFLLLVKHVENIFDGFRVHLLDCLFINNPFLDKLRYCKHCSTVLERVMKRYHHLLRTLLNVVCVVALFRVLVLL